MEENATADGIGLSFAGPRQTAGPPSWLSFFTAVPDRLPHRLSARVDGPVAEKSKDVPHMCDNADILGFSPWSSLNYTPVTCCRSYNRVFYGSRSLGGNQKLLLARLITQH